MPAGIDNLNFEQMTPDQVSDDLWEPIRQLSLRAFGSALERTRTPQEVDYYVGDSVSFKTTRLNPQELVGGRLNADQDYSRPIMALATDKVTNEPVGSVYSADNVSGATEEIRRYKVQTRIKHYRWIRELVVDPDYQGLGVGQVLAYMALNTGLLAQRATVYAFPLEIPKLDAVIKKIGGTPTGPTVPKDGYFGKDSEPVMQQRYEISTARSAARRLSKTPAVKQSLASINMHR